MDKIVEVVVALCMFYQGGIIEHTYKKSKYTLEVNANSFKGKIGDSVSFSEVVE